MIQLITKKSEKKLNKASMEEKQNWVISDQK